MPSPIQVIQATFADLPQGQIVDRLVQRQRLLEKLYKDPDSLTPDEDKLLNAYCEAEYRLKTMTCTCNAGSSVHRQSCPLYPDHKWNEPWAQSWSR